MRVQHSCQNQVQPAFFADPGVRLHAVLSAVPNAFEASICGDDLGAAPDFSDTLQKVADRIGGLLPACIPAALTDAAHPDCVVEDVSTDDAGDQTVREIPRCDVAMGVFPCWRVEDKPACKDSSPQSLGVTVDRDGAEPPPDTTLRVFCSTLAN